MNNYLEELIGTWGQAIGSVTDAISSAPSYKFSETFKTSLSLLGNIMQAIGNTLIADSIKNPKSLDKIGNIIQSIGNSTVVLGLLIKSRKEIQIELGIIGNSLQAFGNLLTSLSESVGDFEKANIEKIGSILQAIGSSLQALSGILELKGKDGEYINFIGSWTAASGAVLQALVLSENGIQPTR
ncbi:DUF6944 family repetitive protein [Neobacillus sp. NPDC097160]|uniref:DUF6944 family repetitive protein n=1 Tax=Neobacillus sp. NPDC097160 TaxID=3364298 RepID=UPI00382A4116